MGLTVTGHGIPPRTGAVHNPPVATKPRNLPEPFRTEHRTRLRQWAGGVTVLFAGAILMLVAQLPAFAGFLFVLLVVLVFGGAVWVGGPGRQYDRARLHRGIGE
jgi:hypothetical protein